MHDKHLYWVDDSVKTMSMVLENLFPAIWDSDISCEIILFGNHYCSKEDEHGPTEEDCASIAGAIRQAFCIYCQYTDDREWREQGETYELKKEIFKDPAIRLIPMKAQSEGTDHKTEQMAKDWMNSTKLEKLSSAAKDPNDQKPIQELLLDQGMEVDTLIEAMELEENSVVALDICLLYGDDQRIREGVPVICMALYDALSKKKHSVFLYSDLAISKEAKESWLKTYETFFGDTSEVLIHGRYSLVTKDQDTEGKRALLELLGGKRM